jgi:hypothetical protein
MQQNSAWYADLIGSEMNRLWEALPLERQAAVDSSIAREDPFTILPQVIELLQS